MMSTNIPGPRGLPLLGSLAPFAIGPLQFLTRLSREYGDVSTFRLGAARYVFINHPRHIDKLVRTHSAHRSDVVRLAMRSFLGDGLLSLEGTPHLRHRRLVQPAFHRQRMQAYAELMLSECDKAIARWSDGRERDLRKAMMELTFAIVSGALFSTDTSREAEKVDAALRRIAPSVARYAKLARLLPRPVSPFYAPATRRAIAELSALVQQLVAARRRDGVDRGDLLSMLLAARDEEGGGLSDADVAAEALTILLAGHETTAHTLTWAYLLLHSHPQIAGALAEEAQRVLGEGRPAFDDLSRLELSERVVKETLRLYPAAWIGDRVPAEPMTFGDVTVPAGVPVIFSVYVTHRDDRFFEHPEAFDPDRFLPERASSIPDGAFLPFGAGVHLCIGNAFALLEARIILSRLAQRLRVVPTQRPSPKPQPNVTLEMAHPFPVRFASRTSGELPVRQPSSAFEPAA
jgi:cytochrome P450